jgi:hypothetical protein
MAIQKKIHNLLKLINPGRELGNKDKIFGTDLEITFIRKIKI